MGIRTPADLCVLISATWGRPRDSWKDGEGAGAGQADGAGLAAARSSPRGTELGPRAGVLRGLRQLPHNPHRPGLEGQSLQPMETGGVVCDMHTRIHAYTYTHTNMQACVQMHLH